MRVSIALCTFDGAKHLGEQLASYLAQTRLPDELVVADDGSTDETQAILQGFAASAPFPVRLLPPSERPLGVTANFERALAACDGDVLFPSDQDDVWLPGKLERMLRPFATPGVGLVCGDAELVDGAGRPLGAGLWSTLGFSARRRRQVQEGRAFEVLLKAPFVSGMSSAVRRSLVDRARPFPAAWVFDGWLGLWAAAISSVAIVEGPVVRYRQHGANQIGARQRSWLEATRHALELPRERYRAVAVQMSIAADRLGPALDPARRAALADCARHFEARSALAPSRPGRLRPIVNELARGRYARFSQGIASAARDLLG